MARFDDGTVRRGSEPWKLEIVYRAWIRAWSCPVRRRLLTNARYEFDELRFDDFRYISMLQASSFRHSL